MTSWNAERPASNSQEKNKNLSPNTISKPEVNLPTTSKSLEADLSSQSIDETVALVCTRIAAW